MAKQEITLKGLDGQEDHLVYDAANGQVGDSLEECARSLFPQEGETTPRLRFQGFKGEWEKKRLSTIAKFSKGYGYSKNDLREHGTPIILYGRLYTKYSTVIDNVDTYAIKENNAIISKGNEIIIPASGETPEDIACAAVVAQKGVILGGDLNILELAEGYDPQFTALAITYSPVHWQLSKYAQGKSVVHLHNAEIGNAIISYPPLVEQKAIASFFRRLDEQIAIQQQRLDKLKQMKSACLRSMFPQNGGGNFPLIRFNGFIGEWKKKSLRSMEFIITAGGDADKSLMKSKGKYPVVANGMTDDGIIGYYDDYYRIKGPAVTVTGRGDVGIAQARHYSFTPVVRLLAIQSKHDVDFLANAINSQKIIRESTGVPQLTTSQLSECSILFPDDIREEQQIGAFFRSLDTKISLQTQRIEKLKQMKTACLSKMIA